MANYLTGVFSRALNQLLLLFGGIFLLAFLLCHVAGEIRGAGESLLGPRQVGKTTVGEGLASNYLSWDDDDVRKAVMAGQKNAPRRLSPAIFSRPSRGGLILDTGILH